MNREPGSTRYQLSLIVNAMDKYNDKRKKTGKKYTERGKEVKTRV